jgi:hypothetical protein
MKTWHITVFDAPVVERMFRLQEGVLLLGSSRECEIRSEAGGVAPRHAEFLGREGKLQLRLLDDGLGVLLNGVTVLGLMEVPCPASLEIGPLRISIEEVVSPECSPPDSDFTARIVHSLPAAGSSSHHRVPSADNGIRRPVEAPSSLENTIAFSMEIPDLAMDDKVPVRTDYSVKAEIARGGMGKIFSAEDPLLKRMVALKVSTVGDRTQDAKFSLEAEVLAALEHPNIVPIHNLGVNAEGRPFYSMKLIQGRTLQWIIKQLAAGDPETEAAYTRQRLLALVPQFGLYVEKLYRETPVKLGHATE